MSTTQDKFKFHPRRLELVDSLQLRQLALVHIGKTCATTPHFIVWEDSRSSHDQETQNIIDQYVHDYFIIKFNAEQFHDYAEDMFATILCFETREDKLLFKTLFKVHFSKDGTDPDELSYYAIAESED